MTDITRYAIWVCFGVDATSPRQAKSIVKQIIGAENEYREGIYKKAKATAVVFMNPELEMLFGEEHHD